MATVYVSNYYDSLTNVPGVSYSPTYCYFDLMTDGTARLVGLPTTSPVSNLINFSLTVYYPLNAGSVTQPNIQYKQYTLKTIGNGLNPVTNSNSVNLVNLKLTFPLSTNAITFSNYAFQNSTINSYLMLGYIASIGDYAFQKAKGNSFIIDNGGNTWGMKPGLGSCSFQGAVFNKFTINLYGINRNPTFFTTIGVSCFENFSPGINWIADYFINSVFSTTKSYPADCFYRTPIFVSKNSNDMTITVSCGEESFANSNPNTARLNFEGTTKMLDNRAFMNYSNVTMVVKTSSVGNVSLGAQVFANCTKLKSYNIMI